MIDAFNEEALKPEQEFYQQKFEESIMQIDEQVSKELASLIFEFSDDNKFPDIEYFY